MKTTHQLADNQQGWVRLQRSILDAPIIKNPTLIQTYTWSLLKANHQPKWFSIKIGKGYREVYCDVGQFITGRNRAAEELGIPGSTWYTNITKLKEYGYLEVESNSHYSLITVVNYGGAAPVALPMKQQKKKAKNNKATAKEQLTNTNNNDKKENKVKNKELTISNNLENSKNEKIEKWVDNAYHELLGIIAREYPKIDRLPKELTADEFKELFSMYDWVDIKEKCNALEYWEPIELQKSLYQILKVFLNKDKNISLIAGIEANSYISHKLFEEKRYNVFLEEQRHKKLADGYYDNISDDAKALFAELKDATIWDEVNLSSHKNSKRKVIKNYLRFKFLLGQQKRISRAYDLSEFHIETYLEFVDAGFTFEALRYYIDQLANWPYLKSYTNIFEGYGEFLNHLMDIGKYEHD